MGAAERNIRSSTHLYGNVLSTNGLQRGRGWGQEYPDPDYSTLPSRLFRIIPLRECWGYDRRHVPGILALIMSFIVMDES